jgi:hypothetical protein
MYCSDPSGGVSVRSSPNCELVQLPIYVNVAILRFDVSRQFLFAVVFYKGFFFLVVSLRASIVHAVRQPLMFLLCILFRW